MINLLIMVTTSMAEDSGPIAGTWSANGTKELLPFEDGREVSLFKVSGLVKLQDAVGSSKDYWSQCFGLTDSSTGAEARCTWKSLDGQKIFLTLHSKPFAEGSHVNGEIIGGTGAVEGITGSIQFDWETMTFQKGSKATAVGGFSKDLTGTYQIP